MNGMMVLVFAIVLAALLALYILLYWKRQGVRAAWWLALPMWPASFFFWSGLNGHILELWLGWGLILIPPAALFVLGIRRLSKP